MSTNMNVQPITGYLCLRCMVQGMLQYTKTCWSCGQVDMLRAYTPFMQHQFTGMTLGGNECVRQRLENLPATFAARFGGASRGLYVPSPSDAPAS